MMTLRIALVAALLSFAAVAFYYTTTNADDVRRALFAPRVEILPLAP